MTAVIGPRVDVPLEDISISPFNVQLPGAVSSAFVNGPSVAYTSALLPSWVPQVNPVTTTLFGPALTLKSTPCHEPEASSTVLKVRNDLSTVAAPAVAELGPLALAAATATGVACLMASALYQKVLEPNFTLYGWEELSSTAITPTSPGFNGPSAASAYDA